jgi:outer membrane protein
MRVNGSTGIVGTGTGWLRRGAALVVGVLLAPAGGAAQTAGVAGEQARVISLDEAVRLALAHDPAAVAAETATRGAEADVLQARGAWLPTFSLGTGYANSSNERFDQATGRLVSESYTAQAQAGIDLFAGGARVARQASAGAELAATRAQLREQRFQTILATTETYFAVAAAAELERAAQQRLERARQQLDFARTRLELGTATASDVLRAEIEVGNAELAVLEAQSSLRGAGLNLGRRIGRSELVLADPRALPDRAPPLPDLAVLLERAARGAPAVEAAEATLRSREAGRWVPYAQYLPSLRLTGGYDWFAFDFPPEQRSWNMRLTAALPVLNGFQREAAIRRLDAAERLARARVRDAAIAAQVAVEAGSRDIVSAERRVEIADRGRELALEDLRVQEERYRIGVATILDLQASQLALAEADVAAVRARQLLGSAVARLEAVLGETLGAAGR